MNRNNDLFTTETWYQDNEDADLWQGEHNLLINSEALNVRETFYTIVRVPANSLQTPPALHARAA